MRGQSTKGHGVSEPQETTRKRALGVFVGIVICCAIVGFFLTVFRPAPGVLGYTEEEHSRPASRPAQSYAELREQRAGVDSELYTVAAESLRQRLPPLNAPVEKTPAERSAALEQRAAHRAFDGAPPTIPHPIDQRARPNCLVCHQDGAKIGQLIAPAMSHAPLSSCTQCHAPEVNPIVSDEPSLAAGNSFDPLPFGGAGERAWEGAPPTLPHALWMRERCSSCHGVSGRIGLRTTHPERQNCLQCHAPRALLDQTRRTFALTETTP